MSFDTDARPASACVSSPATRAGNMSMQIIGNAKLTYSRYLSRLVLRYISPSGTGTRRTVLRMQGVPLKDFLECYSPSSKQARIPQPRTMSANLPSTIRNKFQVIEGTSFHEL